MELVEQVESKPMRNEKGQLLPGFSGNPNGLKKGTRHFETLFREAVKKVAEGEGESDDILIVKKVIAKAKEGDLKAADMVMDRTDGKVEGDKEAGNGDTYNIMVINFDEYSNPKQLPTG